ncbi:DNA-directed DNA polymerase [Methylobacterium sp. 4-46]|uniref:DNA polymerase III subunit delta' n=1 Tax=unclassified Methylobacterium TaxID=2615210 RepID=UPI000152CBF9|nr:MULTISPECIES: DNA polymerase III subunit delta' [Methylobacterium]ACA20545.1 DNA-directed DNA polymerase [Methylobacterium sp. 4-46]WFT79712.1 DNA polymerase III subunit delta' [Methylobacterium nodulans]
MPPEATAEDLEPGDVPGIARPRARTVLIGQEAAERAFREAIGAGRLHHAWLLGGPRGIGKATLAYRVARHLLAHGAGRGLPETLAVPETHPVARQVASLAHPNLVVLRRQRAPGAKTLPTQITVEAARRALHLFAETSADAGYRVCVVDCAEELNLASANALLKLIEEPPPRSLFLIVSHAPGRLLPTIRSRCRRLGLRPLGEGEVVRVLRGLGEAVAAHPPEVLARAAALSEGSVARALGLLDPATLALVDEVEALLRAPDWRRVLALAERLSGREAEALYEVALDTAQRHLAAEIGRRLAEPPARLAALAEASERIARVAREAATYNLDRRPVILSLFEEVAAAR